MRARTKTAIAILTIFSIAAVGAVTFAAADVREIGRSDPKRAANVDFRGGRVAAIRVYYINFEAI